MSHRWMSLWCVWHREEDSAPSLLHFQLFYTSVGRLSAPVIQIQMSFLSLPSHHVRRYVCFTMFLFRSILLFFTTAGTNPSQNETSYTCTNTYTARLTLTVDSLSCVLQGCRQGRRHTHVSLQNFHFPVSFAKAANVGMPLKLFDW